MQTIRGVWNTGSVQYTTDRGTLENLTRKFGIPTDLTVAQMTSFIVAMKGNVSTDAVPCGLRGEGKHRYVNFIRQSGHVISAPVYLRNDAVDTVRDGRDALNTANPNNPVVCIELHGEHFPNLYDDLVTSNAPPAQIPEVKPPATVGKTSVKFSFIMIEYKSDSTAAFGANIIMPARINSESQNAPPTNFAPIANCLGTLGIANCGAKQVRKYRRYIPKFLTTNADLPQQSLTVPVASSVPAEIATCGQNLANLPHVVCLEYKGESNPRFDKVL